MSANRCHAKLHLSGNNPSYRPYSSTSHQDVRRPCSNGDRSSSLLRGIVVKLRLTISKQCSKAGERLLPSRLVTKSTLLWRFSAMVWKSHKTYEIECESYKTIIVKILILSKFNILVQKDGGLEELSDALYYIRNGHLSVNLCG